MSANTDLSVRIVSIPSSNTTSSGIASTPATVLAIPAGDDAGGGCGRFRYRGGRSLSRNRPRTGGSTEVACRLVPWSASFMRRA